MTHQAVEVGPGRVQYLFTGFPEQADQNMDARHEVLVFLQEPHTVSDIADALNLSKNYVVNLIGKYRSQIESVGFRGHQKIYWAKS